MSWDEFKNDIGGIWSFVKWTILIIVFLVGAVIFVGSCVEGWEDIF